MIRQKAKVSIIGYEQKKYKGNIRFTSKILNQKQLNPYLLWLLESKSNLLNAVHWDKMHFK